MRKASLILFVSVTFLSSLLISCGDDASTTMYDLRTLSQVYETLDSATKDGTVAMNHRQFRGHGSISSEQNVMKQACSAMVQASSNQTTTYTYEYGENAHLYWTTATYKDNLGATISTGTQTLDGDGFPIRRIWYDGGGSFLDAYNYTYDKSLFLRISYIQYIDDPTDNPDATKSYEYSNEWNNQGIFVSRAAVSYHSNDIKASEEKVRSVIQRNALRGSGGVVFWEYYREYEGGKLTYQEKGTFDSYGYPKTFSVDSNGDGIYDETYHFETEMTVEGYLESLVMIEDETNTKILKETYAYDAEGLLKTWKWYDVVDDEFVLDIIYTFVWYKNPVNGPTGGEFVLFHSDESGNPVSDYTTINWTETQKVYRNYSSPGHESNRETYSLEKIILP